MQLMRKKLFLLNVMILLFIGLLMVYSSSHIWADYKFDDSYFYIKRQAAFAFLGIIVMIIVSKIDYHVYYQKCKLITGVSLLLLVLVLIPGLGVVRGGSRSWFSIAGLSLQPSEVFKIAIIIFSAKYISDNFIKMKKFKTVIPILLMTGLGFLLIMLQPDFGTGFIMVCSIIVMIMVTGFPFKYFIYLGILGIAGIVGLIASAPYRIKRILAYLDPFSDPLGSGFQMIQSLYAIGPGGILGVGFDQSFQKHFYLPEPQTDFIFAIFCEEFGFLGGVVLILLFAYLIYQALDIALHAKDIFGCYLAIGLTAMIGIQVMINLGVVVGVFPVTGVTLPFISYGGSSLTILLFSVGILVNISNNN